jgi:hypothetical protein
MTSWLMICSKQWLVVMVLLWYCHSVCIVIVVTFDAILMVIPVV